MVKVLIAKNIHALLQQGSSFLDRTSVRVFPAASNEELLQIHRRERVDLIITDLDMPGMSSEDLFSLIRGDKDLRFVPVIMVCENSPVQIEKCAAGMITRSDTQSADRVIFPPALGPPGGQSTST